MLFVRFTTDSITYLKRKIKTIIAVFSKSDHKMTFCPCRDFRDKLNLSQFAELVF